MNIQEIAKKAIKDLNSEDAQKKLERIKHDIKEFSKEMTKEL